MAEATTWKFLGTVSSYGKCSKQNNGNHSSSLVNTSGPGQSSMHMHRDKSILLIEMYPLTTTCCYMYGVLPVQTPNLRGLVPQTIGTLIQCL